MAVAKQKSPPLVQPSPQLAAITGPGPISRSEVTLVIWRYIKRNNLQDTKNKRMVNADDRLKAVFNGRNQVSMFELPEFVGKHLAPPGGDTSGTPWKGNAPRRIPTPKNPPKRNARAGTPSDKQVEAFLADSAALDAKVLRQTRREQRFLRRFLFNGESSAQCAICGRVLPTEMLVAAHIKPRSQCSEPEKRRVRDNIMAACVLGCDALFERGLLFVVDGKVSTRITPDQNASVREVLDSMHGRDCGHRGEGAAPFFNWHATHSVPKPKLE